ncbi:MAG: ABC transporter ATP-binding protein [Candidatus Delongbacteria bacterium]|nr:ABC transporter ATP-binding protein [Candidatus Delongbacteria bacterium]MBN2836889.1 ABC transporter ATP-binding protein [Candidatus Delongbacteria bacterium]
MIKSENIDKIYTNGQVITRALTNVSLELKKGEMVAVNGPSGCGKTTLLNILGLLDRDFEGRVFLDGKDTKNLSDSELRKIRSNKIGFIFQNFHLIDNLDVYSNIELPLKYIRLSRGERKSLTNHVIEKMGLTDIMRLKPDQLSGGMMQKVAIARAAVNSPSLILADEPTGNLDSKQGHDIINFLRELNNEGTTILYVTHSKEQSDLCDRIIRIFDGRILSVNDSYYMEESSIFAGNDRFTKFSF